MFIWNLVLEYQCQFCQKQFGDDQEFISINLPQKKCDLLYIIKILIKKKKIGRTYDINEEVEAFFLENYLSQKLLCPTCQKFTLLQKTIK